MATAEFFVKEQDTSGGSEQTLLKWTAQQGVTKPVVEAVMISTAFHQGISLISPGRVIEERSSKSRESALMYRGNSHF